MNQIEFNIDPSIMETIVHVLQIFMAKEVFGLLVSSAVIGAFTFGILELFMKAGLMVEFPHKKMDNKKARAFTTSCILVAITVLPIAIPLISAFSGKTAFMHGMRNIMVAVIISTLGCWIMSWILKGQLGREARRNNPEYRRQLLLGPAMRIITDTIGAYAADWLARFFLGIANLFIKTIHKPFIMHYAPMAVILNITISFVLISIMGVSNAAGQANLAGSVMGGIAHALFRRGQVKQLREQYLQERGAQNADIQ